MIFDWQQVTDNCTEPGLFKDSEVVDVSVTAILPFFILHLV